MAEEGTKEFISGPGNLDEYLARKSQLVMQEIAYYNEQLEKYPFMAEGTRRVLSMNREEFRKISNTREELSLGEKKPGLSILEQEIKSIEEGIRFNREHGHTEAVQQQNTALGLLQMLHEQETGIKPRHYGSTGNREGYYLPEMVGRSDLAYAALFRHVMALGSYIPPTNGNYPSPESVDTGMMIGRLFDFDCGLTEEEKALMVKQVGSIREAIKRFAIEKFKHGLDRSRPMFPDPKMKPQEIIRFTKDHEIDQVPNALFYIEGGDLVCRFSKENSRKSQVYDLAQSDEGLELMTVVRIEELPADLQGKILELLSSDELKEHWEKIVPTTQKPG